MKTVIRIIFFLLIITPTLSAKIQWERVLSEPEENWAYAGNIQQISCIDSLNCKALVEMQQFFFRLVSSTDGGKTWHITYDETVPDDNPSYIPNPAYAFTMAYVDSLHLFFSRNAGVISRSRNGGLTYDTIKVLSPKDSALLPVNSGWLRNLSMCDRLTGITNNTRKNCLLITEDAWESWKEVKTLPAIYGIGNGFSNTMHMFDKNNFLVYTFDTGLSRTIDGGQTWHYCNLPYKYFTRMRFKDRNIGYAVCADPGPAGDALIGYIMKTTDGGFTWETILMDDKEPMFGLLDVDFRDDSVGIAVGKYGKLYETYDGGKTWEKQPKLDYDVEMDRAVQVIAFAGDHPLVGTWLDGLWRGTYVTNGAAEETVSPNKIEATVFPNPFVESCMIKLRLDAPSPVAVEIYDAIGRVVERREMFYSGSGELMFSPRGLAAPGLYRYRIAAGQKTFTGSMVKE